MRVLLTGATGFIGNHVATELLRNGHEVIATSRHVERARACPWFPRVRYIPQDLNERVDDYYELFERPDALIHLAWEGLPRYDDLFHVERNLLSNYFFLRNVIAAGLPRCTVTGTCLEYGLQSGPLRENLETKPVTAYGLAKDTLRRFLEHLQFQCTFSLKWIRLFYLHGEGQDRRSIIPQLEEALSSGAGMFRMSGGEQLRDYMPVTLAARHIVRIATQDQVNGIINCCSGKPISVLSLVQEHLATRDQDIELILGHYPYPEYEPMEFWGDVHKLQHAIGASE